MEKPLPLDVVARGTLKTLGFSAICDAVFRCQNWSGLQVPVEVLWELFNWDLDTSRVILSLVYNSSFDSALISFDGRRFLCACILLSRLVSISNKRRLLLEVFGSLDAQFLSIINDSLRFRVLEQHDTFSSADDVLKFTESVCGVISSLENQSRYAYRCPLHPNINNCCPLRFHELYVLFLFWNFSRVFNKIRNEPVISIDASEKLIHDLRTLLDSKVLPYLKSDISRLSNLMSASDGSLLFGWLCSNKILYGNRKRHALHFADFIAAVCPCISSYYIMRIEEVFKTENEPKLLILSSCFLSKSEMKVADLAVRGHSLYSVPELAKMARDVCQNRVGSRLSRNKIQEHDFVIKKREGQSHIGKPVTKSRFDSLVFEEKLPLIMTSHRKNGHEKRMAKLSPTASSTSALVLPELSEEEDRKWRNYFRLQQTFSNKKFNDEVTDYFSDREEFRKGMMKEVGKEMIFFSSMLRTPRFREEFSSNRK